MFLSLCTFGCGSQEVNSREIHLQSTFDFFRRGGINKTKLEKKTKSFFLIVTVVVAKVLYWNTVTLGEPLRRREIEI